MAGRPAHVQALDGGAVAARLRERPVDPPLVVGVGTLPAAAPRHVDDPVLDVVRRVGVGGQHIALGQVGGVLGPAGPHLLEQAVLYVVVGLGAVLQLVGGGAELPEQQGVLAFRGVGRVDHRVAAGVAAQRRGDLASADLLPVLVQLGQCC